MADIAVSEFSIKGMHCDSCVKTLRKAIGSVAGVKDVNIDLNTGKAMVEYDPENTTMKAITSAVETNGYKAVFGGNPNGGEPSVQMSGLDIFSHLFFDKTRFHAERGMLRIAVLTFVALSALEIVAYYAFFVNNPAFAARNYGTYIFYLILAVTLTGSALWHLDAYRKKVTCQTGMMMGMTLGMLSGFLLGAIVGATNGMFAGSAFGMIVGMLFGVYGGRCCGIMGIMEGLMAGFMGGIMGAMTTIMLINDNMLLFFPLIFSSSAIILTGLTYMIYKDYNHGMIGKANPNDLQSHSFSIFITFAFSLTMATTWIIVYGPRSVLFQ
ncbi:MAG: heavy metal translocating P-type ATPase [Candidatus Aenigmarchaeota archaeon]|nr:heavy metal translocating P-type ATPase [Candidatus Aenigmarchaeota archaeon]